MEEVKVKIEMEEFKEVNEEVEQVPRQILQQDILRFSSLPPQEILPPPPVPLQSTKFEQEHDNASWKNLPEEMVNEGKLNASDDQLRLDVDYVPLSAVWASIDKSVNSLESKFLVTAEQFTGMGQKLWGMVFGKENVLPEKRLTAWYDRVCSMAEINQCLLDSALSVLQSDNSLKRQERRNVLRMTGNEIAKAQDKSSSVLLERQRELGKYPDSELSTTSGIMMSGTSPLQIFLSYQFHKSREELKGIMEKEDDTEDPIYWIPTTSNLPYQVFQRIVKQRFESKNFEVRLSSEAVKIRYVEFMTKSYGGILLKSRVQCIAAIFTAFGPNLYTYPARVIELLHSKTLVRNDLGLPHFKSPPKTFPALDTCCLGTATAPPVIKKKKIKKKPRELPPSPYPTLPPLSLLERYTGDKSKSSTESAPAAEARPGPSSSAVPFLKNGIPRNSANLVPLGTRAEGEGDSVVGASAPPLQKYVTWLTASERGLKRLGLEVLSENGFQEVYDRHLIYSQEPMNNDFMLGVLTGISISLKSREEQEQLEMALEPKLPSPTLPQPPRPSSVPRMRLNRETPPAVYPPMPPNPPPHPRYFQNNEEYPVDVNYFEPNYSNQAGYIPNSIPGPTRPTYRPRPMNWPRSPEQRHNLAPRAPPCHYLAPRAPQRHNFAPQAPRVPYSQFGHQPAGQPPLPPLPPHHQHFRREEILPPPPPPYYPHQNFAQEEILPPPPPPPPPSPPLQNPPVPPRNYDQYSWKKPEIPVQDNYSSRIPLQEEFKKPHPPVLLQETPTKRPRPPPPPPPPPPMISLVKEKIGEESEYDHQMKKRKFSGGLDSGVNVENGMESVVFDYSHGQ